MVVSVDVAAEPLLSGAERQAYARSDVRAYVVVPLIKGGRHVAFTAVHQDSPRNWMPDEIALIEETAERTWAAVERARAERALAESEERFRAFVLASTDIVYCMSPDWKEMRYLKGREFISDTSEPSTDWLQRYIAPIDQSRVLESIREAIRTESVFELEHRVRRVDGTLGWTHSRAVPILNSAGEIVEWFGAARDVTLRKGTEETLYAIQEHSARQRRLYEGILSNTPDLAYIFDPQHRFIYVNEGLLKMWGRTLEESVGKTCLELGYEPWHAEMHNREIDQVIATKQPIRGEVPFNGTFGRRIYDYIFVPIFGPNGEVEAVAGTTRDVTERKEADRRKDEFLATLAHELRNPRAPIRSSIHILSLSAQGDPTTERVCEMMERQVNHMVRLVDDLLEISRITRGTIELRKEQVSLATIIRTAIDTSTPAINAGGHQLAISLPQEPVQLFGDSVRLSQVVSNLLNNAARYTDRGGQIWLNAEKTDSEIIIRVRDNGIGIPAESLPLVFDMFMQVERTTTRAQGGLGIGLTLVKRLVEMHGGTVTVQSPGAGLGSEFCVRLPYISPPIDSMHRMPVSSAAAPQKHRVLVVDDNQDAATSLGMLVKVLGSEVQVVNDGPTALAVMETFRPNVVLLDLGMPKMDGFEVAQRARQIRGCENAVLIALTGWGRDDDRERTLAAGFNHHLVKPAGMTELQTLLGSLRKSGAS